MKGTNMRYLNSFNQERKMLSAIEFVYSVMAENTWS